MCKEYLYEYEHDYSGDSLTVVDIVILIAFFLILIVTNVSLAFCIYNICIHKILVGLKFLMYGYFGPIILCVFVFVLFDKVICKR